ALLSGADESRAKELLAAPATASQSLVSTLHNTLHSDPDTRPWYPSSRLKAVSWLIGGLLTGLILLRAGRTSLSGPAVVVVLGALMVIMMLLSPVCHRHYFCLSVPLVMGLLAAGEGRPDPRANAGLLLVLAANVVAHLAANLPGCEWLRD